MNFIRISLLLLLIFLTGNLQAQVPYPSHLLEEPYDSLITIFDKNRRKDTLLARQACYAYLSKARKDNDSTKMARAHEKLYRISSFEEAIMHIDSAIYLSRNSTHKDFPTLPYILKSHRYYNHDYYEKSLDNSITAYNSAKTKKNIKYQISSLILIQANNNMWGDYRNGINSGKKIIHLIKNPQSTRDNRRIMHANDGIATSYIRLGMQDSALYHIKKSISLALNFGTLEEYHKRVAKSGAALYFKGDYASAKDSLIKGYQNGKYLEKGKFSAFPYYMGQIAIKEVKEAEGIVYFKEIDSTYRNDSILYPELAQVYHKLVNHYKEKGDVENQLTYLQRLIYVDSLIDAKNQYVKFKTLKEYEVPKLKREKEALIASFNKEKGTLTHKIQWLLAILILSGLIGFYYFRKQQLYKKRFHNILANRKEIIPKDKTPSSKLTFSEEIFQHILKKLQDFETNKNYLNKNTNLQNLAKKFDTNANYLSKTINASKGKNFAQYLNDLRLGHATQWLQEDPKARKYTVKAIAQDSGYKTAESFSRAFYKKYGIQPSFFIKQLNKTVH